MVGIAEVHPWIADVSMFQWHLDRGAVVGGVSALGVVLASAGWWIKWKIETQHEIAQAQRSAALAACKNVRELVADWESAVREAVELAESPDETIEKIKRSIEADYFWRRLDQEISHASNEIVPECGSVAKLANEFKDTALNVKEYLKDSLQWSLIEPGEEPQGLQPGTDVWRRERYKLRKQRVLQRLLSVGEELKGELNNAMKRLVTKGAS